MFNTLIDPRTKPRRSCLSASIALHIAVILIIILVRPPIKHPFVLLTIVRASNVDVISPAKNSQVVLPESVRPIRQPVEARFSEPEHRNSVQNEDAPPSAIVPSLPSQARIAEELVNGMGGVDAGSFQSLPKTISVSNEPVTEADPLTALPPREDPVHEAISPSVRLPKLLSSVVPEYPAVARTARVQGIVELEATVNEQGAVTNIVVVSGHPFLVKAAIECVRKWRYEPAMVGDHTVSAPLRVTVRFHLNFVEGSNRLLR